MSIVAQLYYEHDLEKGVLHTILPQSLLTGDENAHEFIIALKRGESDADLTGATVYGYFVRSDGVTVLNEGTIDGNKAKVKLIKNCYAKAGRYNLYIKLIKGEETATVFWATGSESLSSTDTVVVDENIIPSVEELLKMLENGGGTGEPGKDGEDGATYTPHVDEAGNLSWTNDKGLSNPATVNIKGATGATGATGAKGEKGDPGENGEPGKDGSDGSPGKDGVSVTHSWNGSVLTLTSASGTSYVDLKGERGEKGDTGLQGIQGEPGKDGAKGEKGDKGDTGADGKTPQKGVDYWTPTDQESIVQDVIAALGTPVFGTVDENKHITLSGHLADGTYTMSFEDSDGFTTNVCTIEKGASSGRPIGVNLIPLSINVDGTPYVGENGELGYKAGYRLNSSGTETAHENMFVTGFMPVETGDTVSLDNVWWSANNGTYNYRCFITLYDESFARIGSTTADQFKKSVTSIDGIVSGGVFSTFDIGDGNANYDHLVQFKIDALGAKYLRMSSHLMSPSSVIMINET